MFQRDHPRALVQVAGGRKVTLLGLRITLLKGQLIYLQAFTQVIMVGLLPWLPWQIWWETLITEHLAFHLGPAFRVPQDTWTENPRKVIFSQLLDGGGAGAFPRRNTECLILEPSDLTYSMPDPFPYGVCGALSESPIPHIPCTLPVSPVSEPFGRASSPGVWLFPEAAGSPSDADVQVPHRPPGPLLAFPPFPSAHWHLALMSALIRGFFLRFRLSPVAEP